MVAGIETQPVRRRDDDRSALIGFIVLAPALSALARPFQRDDGATPQVALDRQGARGRGGREAWR